MNYVPDGLNYESSEEDFIEFDSNTHNYDDSYKENLGTDADSVAEASPGAFLRSRKVANGVFVSGGKVRLFNDLRDAVISQNIQVIQDFCDNAPDWDSRKDDTGFTTLDYALAYATPASLTTILNHSIPSGHMRDFSVPVGILRSRAFKTVDHDNDGDDNDVERCLRILKTHGYSNLAPIPIRPHDHSEHVIRSHDHSEHVIRSHDHSEHVTTKSADSSINGPQQPPSNGPHQHTLPSNQTDLLGLFLKNIHLSILLPLFKAVQFKSFLLMDEQAFLELGISQPGIISRLTDAILDFHRCSWRPESLHSNNNIFRMKGVELASLFRNMAEHLELIECSIEFARRSVLQKQLEGVDASQGWQYQLMQLKQSRDVLREEVLEFNEKFERFYRTMKRQNPNMDNSSSFSSHLPTLLILTILPFVAFLAILKLKS